MTKRKKIALSILAALFLSALLLYAFRRPILLSLMKRQVTHLLTSSVFDDLPEGLHVVLCGAGSPLPDPERSGPCVAVIAGSRLFLVDTGAGSSENLQQMQVPHARVEAILLTHFHSDHIDGLGEMLMQCWVNGTRREPMPVYGPKGVERVVEGFNLAYAQDVDYRVAHHGEDVVPRSGAGAVAHAFVEPEPRQVVTLLDEDGLTITAFTVEHGPVRPAVGYRFDYRGRSVLISGDTSPSQNLAHFARGVDLLVHEALSRELVGVLHTAAVESERDNIAKITDDILNYHTTPEEAAEIARDAGAGALLFYHIVPPLPAPGLEGLFLSGVDAIYEGPVTVGVDGSMVSLPVSSDGISTRELL